MRAFVFILLISFTILSCTENQRDFRKTSLPRNGLAENGLKGNVKSMEQKIYQIRHGAAGSDAIPDSLSDDFIISFDRHGHKTKMEYPATKGDVNLQWENHYDRNGNLTEQDWYHSDGKLMSGDRYNYNDRGKLVEVIHFNSEKQGWITNSYQYDAKGRMTEMKNIGYNRGKKQFSTYNYFYGASGRLDSMREYHGDTNRYLTHKYSYNNAGQTTEDIQYNDNGEPGLKVERSYDSAGNMLQMNQYRGDSVLYSKDIYHYDDHNDQVATEHYIQNKIISFKKEANGKAKGVIDRDHLNDAVSFSYADKLKFDANGNWIEKDILDQRGRTNSIIKRSIEYY